jgi:hypothetical protein
MSLHVAIDLGASNGRVIVGDEETFDIAHRFPTRWVGAGGNMFWDILDIFREIKVGLKLAFNRYGPASRYPFPALRPRTKLSRHIENGKAFSNAARSFELLAHRPDRKRIYDRINVAVDVIEESRMVPNAPRKRLHWVISSSKSK